MEEIELKELFKIIWKKKWIFFLLPICVSLVAILATKQIQPVFTATIKVSLGEEILGEPEVVQQLFVNDESLSRAAKKINLQSLENYQDNISVKQIGKTSIVQIEAKYLEPNASKKIVEALAENYLSNSEETYKEKRQPMEKLNSLISTQIEQLGQRLNQSREALVRLDENKTLSAEEKEISRLMLKIYTNQDEMLLTDLTDKMTHVQDEMDKLHKGKLVESAKISNVHSAPHMPIIIAISLIIGVLIAVLYTFTREYTRKTYL